MRQVQIQDVKKGEFVKRTATTLKVYIRADYQRDMKRFQLDDTTDIFRAVYIKRGTLVWVDFEY